MNTVRLVSLLIHTVGLFAYGAITYLAWRDLLQPGWGRGRAQHSRAGCRVTLVGSTFVLMLFAWYALNLAVILNAPGTYQYILQTISLGITFFFPALIMHTTFQDMIGVEPSPDWRWRVPFAAMYVLGAGFGVFGVLGFWGYLGLSGRAVGSIITPALAVMFLSTGIYSARFIGWAHRGRKETAEQVQARRGHMVLYVVLALLFLPMILSVLGLFPFMSFVQAVLIPMIPMGFLFVGTYFEDRFEFFDLFVKHGLFLLLTAVLLMVTFAVLLPVMDGFDLGWERPWVYGLVLLPLGVLLPWLSRKVGSFLDSVWLGRRFTTVEAVKHFLATTQKATSEEELVRWAEEGLTTIFHAEVCIDFSLAAAPVEMEGSLAVPIQALDGERGLIRVGLRKDRMPFLSQDVALLSSLGHVLAYLLENVRLQARKQEQEQRAKELSLHASRSELKALRAQINPHFLFNALNAIAGLIHKDPALADRTVEELAEVFRYTLRGSEKEWARLEDELEFARAYLEVERARFGQRFAFSIETDDDARNLLIPTMMVQTLVENAIKHGVAAVRGPARVDVSGRIEDGSLHVAVQDSGPGFGGEGTTATTGGYGLRNIEQRLDGYFGGAASLTRRRDEARGRTIISIEMPASRQVPRPWRSTAAERQAS